MYVDRNFTDEGYEFFFTFDKEKLSLIPKEEEKKVITHSWFYTKLESGVLAWPVAHSIFV